MTRANRQGQAGNMVKNTEPKSQAHSFWWFTQTSQSIEHLLYAHRLWEMHQHPPSPPLMQQKAQWASSGWCFPRMVTDLGGSDSTLFNPALPPKEVRQVATLEPDLSTGVVSGLRVKKAWLPASSCTREPQGTCTETQEGSCCHVYLRTDWPLTSAPGNALHLPEPSARRMIGLAAFQF